MVKNTNGGSRHKKQARKNINAQQVIRKTRLKDPKEPCEVYGIVNKNFGQGNCEVMCNDGVLRLCIIRNKFKGRNKRGNRIDVGGRVLVGLRDWELRSGNKREKCDLLEVYDTRELQDLKKDVNFNDKLLRSEEEKLNDHKDGTARFVFEKESDSFEDEGTGCARNTKHDTTLHMKELDEIDIDDI